MPIVMDMDIVNALTTTMEIDETWYMIFPFITRQMSTVVGVLLGDRPVQDLDLPIVLPAW